MSDSTQDEFDKLLQDALVGGDDPVPASGCPDPEMGGAASQDDIDALFAAVGAGEPEPAAAAPVHAGGMASQDDIDAMFSASGEDDENAAPESAASSAVDDFAGDGDGLADQDDIDALFSAVEEAAGNAQANGDTEDVQHDSLFESELAAAEAAYDMDESEADSDLNELLSSIAKDAESAALAENDTTATEKSGHNSTTIVGGIDMDELLRQVAAAAPPPLKTNVVDAGDTAVLSPDYSTALAAAEVDQEPGSAASVPAPGVPPPAAATPLIPPRPLPEAAPGGRKEYSVLYGAGEVESLSNQIGALLGSMSEKAHGYMQAWIAADSEAKELRARALGEERRRSSLESEKSALGKQVEELRCKLGEIEEAKIAGEESQRTRETSYQAKVREFESRVTLLASETEALKDELTRVRNQATGVDIESRRAALKWTASRTRSSPSAWSAYAFSGVGESGKRAPGRAEPVVRPGVLPFH